MKYLLLTLAILIPASAQAQNERSRRDLNGEATLIGVSRMTGEIRRIQTDDSGNIVIVSSGTGAVDGSLDQGDAGVQEWLTKTDATTSSVEAKNEAWTVPSESTATVSNVSATQVLFDDSTRLDATICNEESTAMRIGSSNITSAIGLRVLGDTCAELTSGGLKPQGPLHAIQLGGAPGKVSILEVK